MKTEKVFSNWIERRALPKHQQNQAILLNSDTNFEYMIKNLGLSLVDHYWLKPIESDYIWEKINLYDNNFAEVDFQYEDLDNITPFKPE